MSISFTMTVVAPNNSHPFVFLKIYNNLDEAIIWARHEIRTGQAEFILIREGEFASDPVVWDSRVQGPEVIKPIWSHAPVPVGFPLQDVNARFELRAASVLGDYDGKVDFSTWQPHEKEGFRDYRYKQPGVRAAWMMYLDLALKHFDRFGTVV